ncbi:28S ribosomal protein S5, mitochondrial-like isoform X2 [Varroa jacobsoni]|nr:28S ribosomal protein S5, mitochondrial-like isoform X2 [Varroa destructor]XP_022690363.1 28S ribosomal protein S5, mitochondrial-like isoform X2 [Varroa jacobsoni]
MLWPGLNAPIFRGREVVERQQLPPDPEREKRLIELRDKQQINFRRIRLTPLERGWSGTRAPGRSLGPPDTPEDIDIKDFDSVVLDLRLVSNMTSHLGRVRRHKAVVAVGNGKGLLGFATGRGPDGKTALRKAKNRALLRLCHYPMFEEHTVLHDFFSEYGCTRIVVKQKERGYGLKCHRAIMSLCKLIGIKNLYAKVDTRNTNLLSLTRAFLIGLQKQKTHQDFADEKRLHVVEFRPEQLYFPRIVASPKTGPVRKEDEIDPYEELDINMIVSEGRMIYARKKAEPFYTRLPGWEVHLKKTDNLKNQRQVRLRLMKKYGALKSFLNIRDEKKLPLNQIGPNGQMI